MREGLLLALQNRPFLGRRRSWFRGVRQTPDVRRRVVLRARAARIRTGSVEGVGQGAHQLAKTHCPNGHEYTPENTIIYPSDGRRHCFTCRRGRPPQTTVPDPSEGSPRRTLPGDLTA